MLNKLQTIFPNLIMNDMSLSSAQRSLYTWFKSEGNVVFGIPKKDLSNKEASILIACLQPYDPSIPAPTLREKNWYDVIHHSGFIPIKEWDYFRFVYFSIPMEQINRIEFNEAIKQLFNQNISVLWKNEHEGILIEEQQIQEETIAYDQIIDILMSDLSVKINFLVGPFKKDVTDAYAYYDHMIQAGKTAFYYSDKNVLTFLEVLPFLIIEETSVPLKNQLTETLLEEFIQDKESAHMLAIFLESNLNISLTAKKLYMHRNSLQYRLDRFVEHTGLDIRKFHHAAIVYLALIAIKNRKTAQDDK